MSILLPIASVLLIFLSAFLILIVLAQKAKSDGGMGAAMGGGMAEAAFGAETGNVLTKATINASVAFFILTFLLYLGQVYQHKHAGHTTGGALPTITVPAAPASSAPLGTAPTNPAPGLTAPAPVETVPGGTTPAPTGTPSDSTTAPAPATTAPTATAPAPSATPAEQPKK